MKMKFLGKFVALFAACGLAGAAAAATYDYNGQTITYTGAQTPTKVGDDLVIKFTANGSLTLPMNYKARILAVGGGGAGGYQSNTDGRAGGGGGAGEMVDRSDISLAGGTYKITVGAGGTVPSAGYAGNNGEASSIKLGTTTVVSVLGGGGGGFYTTAGKTGGSGGGGGGPTGNGATTAAGSSNHNELKDYFVNSGGAGARYVGGGGGGAGGAGGGASARSAAGAGGVGKKSDITGDTDAYYAAGGGGGAGRNSGSYTAGTGGSNIGGNGASKAAASTGGAAETGSGGGGGGCFGTNNNRAPGAGGSGIVVVRLSDPSVCRIGSAYYATLEAAVAAAKTGDTIELLKNITLDADLTITKDVTITSASGNYTITRAGQYALNITGNVKFANITVDGGITWANSTISGIDYTGSNASQGKSLITVASGASLTLNSGATIQNFWGRKMAAGDPDTYAAINNAGTLVINNGAVLKDIRHRAFRTASYAAQMGGAVYSTGTVTMNGGTIQNCYSVGKGGAIYAAGGTVDIKGGAITGCAAAQGGGAIYVESDAALNVSGSPTITANNKIADGQTSGTKNNVETETATAINLAGNLTGAVGVSYPASVTSGAAFGAANNSYTGVENFTYDTDASYSSVRKEGKLVWIKPVCEVNGVSYGSLEEAVAAAKDGDTITLLDNVTINSTVTVNKNITITSSGTKRTISRSAADAKLGIAGNVAFDNVTIDGGSGAEAILSLETGGVITTSGNTTLSQNKIALQGKTITFANGQLMRASEADGVMVKYTQDGTLNLPSQATADYLVVGGGGSGARGNRTGNYGSYTYYYGNSYYGNSGDGGEVKPSPPDATLAAGEYTIVVGEGGPAPSNNNTAGNAGKESSLSGPGLTEPVTAKGGTGGTVNEQGGYINAKAGSPTPGTSNSITGSPVVYGQGGDRPKENANANTETRPGWGGQGSYYNRTAGAGAAGVVIINIKSLKDVVNAGMRTVYAGDSITLTNDVAWGEGWTVRSLDESVATVAESGSDVTVTGVTAGTTTVRVENGSSIYNYTVKVLKKPYSKGILLSPTDGEREVCAISGNGAKVTVADGTVATAVVRDGKLYVTAKKAETTTVTVETDAAIYTVQVNPVVRKTVTLATNASTKTTYSYTFDELYKVEGDGGKVVNVRQDGNTVTFTAVEPGTSSVVRVYAQIEGGQQAILAYTVIAKEVSGGIAPIADTYVEYSGAAKVVASGTDVILVFTNANDLGQIMIPEPYSANVDILAIGGGGAGGSASGFGGAGGGGGAGGYTFVTDKVIEAGVLGIDIGAGGHAYEGLLVGGGVQGASGSPSVVSNAHGYVFASAMGGGGGGGPGPSLTIDGLLGGSGGGATYRGSVAGQGGKAMDGQGREGGKPTNSTMGAGGGGAGATGAAERTGGAGRTSDISGESVLYSQGGNGGVTYKQERGADGQGPGFGGDGGSGAPGGSGADGAIIVHIKDVYKNIKVPVPGTNDVYSADGATLLQAGLVTPRFVWTNGQTYVAFDYEGKEFRSSTDAHARLYSEAFEVVGEVSTNCFETGKFDAEGNPILGGVGYYSFTLHLKPGYSWEDGLGPDTAGSTANKMYRWVVVADESVIDAAIDIHKTVAWADSSNATVVVTTYTSPETQGRTPNVLFLGTLCDGHGMDRKVVTESLKTIVSAANIDYFLYSSNSGETGDNPAAQGHLDLGESNKVDAISLSFAHPKHYSLTSFYNRLYKQLVDPSTKKTYDYVVFEFDGSRVSDSYTTAYQNEAAVVAALKPFYDSKSVIWIVDNCDAGSNEPYREDYWRPNTYWHNNYQNNMGITQYRGLVGLFDPAHYIAGGTFNQIATTSKSVTKNWSTNYGGVSRNTVYANDRWDLQATYDNVSGVADLLRRVIKVKPYNLNLRDKIVSPEKGLTLTGVTIQVNTNGTDKTATSASDDWADLITWNTDGSTVFTPAKGVNGASIAVDMSTNLIQAVISNVDFQVWTRVNIHVVDDGRFRTTEDAVYNQKTGKWEKNPNEGKAFAEMFDGMGLAMNIDGEAETDTPWQMELFMVSGKATHGDIFVGGMDKLSEGFSPGQTVTVYYRGDPGYKIKSVTVDGREVSIDEFPMSYTFTALDANHHVEVVYEPYFGTVFSSPVTNVYDGAMHFYDVTLEGWDESYSNEVRYALADYKDDPDAYTNAEAFAELYGQNWTTAWNPDELPDVGVHRFYYRIYVRQPGYGATFEEPGWVWVDSAQWGADDSVILPRPLLVRPNDSGKIYTNDELPEIGYSFSGFVNGETVADLGNPQTNDWTVASVYKLGDGVGLYATWVATNPAERVGLELNQNRIEEGDPQWTDPTDAGKTSNSGNYYFVPGNNAQPVELIPLSIGDVTQVPGLDPENPLMDTGVDPAKKMYDGIPTNITVEVTSHYVDRPSEPLVEGKGYKITYQVASVDDPTHPTGDVYDKNPTFTHAGTNVVWYFVEPINGQEIIYFPASNYQYVVITPRPLVLESHSATWTFDGAEHRHNVITLNEGTLVNGDTLTTNTTATIVHVGDSVRPNKFDWDIKSGDKSFEGDAKDDYTVTVIEGGLTIKPRPIQVGDVTYPEDPNAVVPYGESGVEDAIKVYDGIPTNITVDVKVPLDPSEYVIHYTTNYQGSASEWTEDPILFTNVTDTTVFYWVEPIGEHKSDYIPGTGYARVVITPAPVTVTADDVYLLKGDPKPETFTAKTGELACPEDEAKKDELIDQHTEHLDAPDYTQGSPVGEYPIVFTNMPSVITQGNYEVTYIPGTLHVEAKPRVLSLWITDHSDAGNGMVHLQFEPKFTVPPVSLTDWATEASKNGRIWVFIGVTPEDTEDTKQVTTKTEGRAYGATLRDMENPVNEKMGRIWITTKEPLPDLNRAGKIVIVGE